MIELLLEIFLEFVLQIVGEVFFDVTIHVLSRAPRVRESLNIFLTLIMYFGVGLFTGFLSLWIFPEAFIRSHSVHGISLLITPTLAGFTMSAIGWLRKRQGKFVIRLETFSCGFIFAFGMA